MKGKLRQMGYEGESVNNLDDLTARMFLAAMKGNINAYRTLMEYTEYGSIAPLTGSVD